MIVAEDVEIDLQDIQNLHYLAFDVIILRRVFIAISFNLKISTKPPFSFPPLFQRGFLGDLVIYFMGIKEE